MQPCKDGAENQTGHAHVSQLHTGAMLCPAHGQDCPEFEAQAASALVISQAQDLGEAIPGAGDPMHRQGIHSAPP